MTPKLIALAAGLALLTGMAMAQNETAPRANGPHRMHGFMGAPEFGMMFHALDLTEQQKTQVRQIVDGEKATLHTLRQQAMASHLELMHVITSGNFDQAKVNSIAAQESETQMKLTLEQAKIASQIFQGVLTSEQKSKVTAMMAEHEQRMQQRMQKKGESAQPSE